MCVCAADLRNRHASKQKTRDRMHGGGMLAARLTNARKLANRLGNSEIPASGVQAVGVLLDPSCRGDGMPPTSMMMSGEGA